MLSDKLGARLARCFLKGLTGVAGLLALTPAVAQAQWWDPEFAYRAKVAFDLGASGAGITETTGRVPVMIKLTTGNFAFKDAKPDGSDLRVLAGDDKTPLKFHLEKFDAAGEVAILWVDVPNLAPNGSTPIYIYYGNEKAKAGGDPKGSFGSGQLIVYHFGDKTSGEDSTAYANNAATPVTGSLSSLIGSGAKFSGTTEIKLAPSASLATEAAGASTVSAWIKPSAEGMNGTIFRQDGGLTVALRNGSLVATAGGASTPAGAVLAPDTWAHVAVRVDGKTITVYVNGAPQGSINGIVAASPGSGGIGSGFVGEMDEFRLAKEALAVGAIQAAALSEGLSPKMYKFDQPESNGGEASYIGVLFSSLTLDGLIVMGILGIMAVIAFYVMWTKIAYIGRTEKGNNAFLAEYDRTESNQPVHLGFGAQETGDTYRHSSIARLNAIGMDALKTRLGLVPGKEAIAAGAHELSSESVAAIRSKMDSGLIRESARLNKMVVFLTIAIAGGPFLGLFGTVVGVMITFAAIAAAGDVNINSIAPGIAAALLATVAGLGVAIPALFGYNYILSRIEAILAEMQIFVDDLEKRIAETYRRRVAGERMVG
jgi:biopolymer transport protein ExbB